MKIGKAHDTDTIFFFFYKKTMRKDNRNQFPETLSSKDCQNCQITYTQCLLVVLWGECRWICGFVYYHVNHINATWINQYLISFIPRHLARHSHCNCNRWKKQHCTFDIPFHCIRRRSYISFRSNWLQAYSENCMVFARWGNCRAKYQITCIIAYIIHT